MSRYDGDFPPIDVDRLRFGHVSPETALVVNDYPYGFRLRTRIRYWIETTKHGDRFVSQTLNPKTDRWNKPKASTYMGVMVMRLDEQDHVTYLGMSENDSSTWIDALTEAIGRERMNPMQLRRLAQIIGYTRAMSKVTWSVAETSGWSPEQRAEHDAEQARHNAALNHLVAVETRLADHPGATAGHPRTLRHHPDPAVARAARRSPI